MKGTGKIAVTCSPSARGTLSIASLDYERAAVSLQRDLRILDGSVVEPMEIIVGLWRRAGFFCFPAWKEAIIFSHIFSKCFANFFLY